MTDPEQGLVEEILVAATDYWRNIASTSPAEYVGRIRLAQSVLAHRFDPTEPRVVLLERILDGLPISDAVTGESGQPPQARSA